jgi:hypothetical protein
MVRFEKLARGHGVSKEAECAKLFWRIYADHVAEADDIRRERSGGEPNPLLNYGYAVLLSTVLQNLFAVGLASISLFISVRALGKGLESWRRSSVRRGPLPAIPSRRRLRTSNMRENLNRQIKRRTRVAGLFPNENSVLRLVTAILMGTSENGKPAESTSPRPPNNEPKHHKNNRKTIGMGVGMVLVCCLLVGVWVSGKCAEMEWRAREQGGLHGGRGGGWHGPGRQGRPLFLNTMGRAKAATG